MNKERIKSILIIFGVKVLSTFAFTTSSAQSNKLYLDPPKLLKNPEIANEYSIESMRFTDTSSFQIYPSPLPNEGILFVDHQKRGSSGHNGQALVEYQKDHILSFYFNSPAGDLSGGGHHPLGWTEYRRSTDGGKSWGPPQVLEYSKYLYDHSDYFSGYVKQAVLAPDGSIVAIGCRFLKDYPEFDSAFYVRSHDGGETWEEAEVFSPDDPVLGRPQATLVNDGIIYVLFTHGPTWGDQSPHRLYVSSNNGTTFTRRSDLTLDDECWYGGMARLDDNRIIAYGYRNQDEHNLQYVTSQDNGHTWSSPATTYLAKKIRNPIMSEKVGGYYFMHGRGGYPGRRQNLVLYSSKDGIQWDEGRYLRVGPGLYAYSNNAVVGRFDPTGSSRLLIQSSIAYDHRKVNVHHWWVYFVTAAGKPAEVKILSFLGRPKFE